MFLHWEHNIKIHLTSIHIQYQQHKNTFVVKCKRLTSFFFLSIWKNPTIFQNSQIPKEKMIIFPLNNEPQSQFSGLKIASHRGSCVWQVSPVVAAKSFKSLRTTSCEPGWCRLDDSVVRGAKHVDRQTELPAMKCSSGFQSVNWSTLLMINTFSGCAAPSCDHI